MPADNNYREMMDRTVAFFGEQESGSAANSLPADFDLAKLPVYFSNGDDTPSGATQLTRHFAKDLFERNMYSVWAAIMVFDRSLDLLDSSGSMTLRPDLRDRLTDVMKEFQSLGKELISSPLEV